MDKNNMRQVFSHYIENFDFINNEEHMEYYKWQICQEFHDIMDQALASDDELFAGMLYQAKVCSKNIIDSFTQPFYGLVKYAEEEPATVKKMFLDLYAPDYGDLGIRMKKIENFFQKSTELLEKYYPGSYLYRQNSHSVSAYLFLYDPEHNYMYKASECNTMADCIGFYDSWGTGDNIKLDVFYRMCDEILEEIWNCQELLRTNESRFDGSLKLHPGTLHPDTKKHILLFDIIYCCKTYDLFNIIPFARPNTKEKKLIIEYREKAVNLKQAYDCAKEKADFLEQALDYILDNLVPGTMVSHRKYGMGTIEQINRKRIQIRFINEDDIKTFGLSTVIAKGILNYDNTEFTLKIKEYKEILLKAESIPSALDFAAKSLEAYADYLQ